MPHKDNLLVTDQNSCNALSSKATKKKKIPTVFGKGYSQRNIKCVPTFCQLMKCHNFNNTESTLTSGFFRLLLEDLGSVCTFWQKSKFTEFMKVYTFWGTMAMFSPLKEVFSVTTQTSLNKNKQKNQLAYHKSISHYSTSTQLFIANGADVLQDLLTV